MQEDEESSHMLVVPGSFTSSTVHRRVQPIDELSNRPVSQSGIDLFIWQWASSICASNHELQVKSTVPDEPVTKWLIHAPILKDLIDLMDHDKDEVYPQLHNTTFEHEVFFRKNAYLDLACSRLITTVVAVSSSAT